MFKSTNTAETLACRILCQAVSRCPVYELSRWQFRLEREAAAFCPSVCYVHIVVCPCWWIRGFVREDQFWDLAAFPVHAWIPVLAIWPSAVWIVGPWMSLPGSCPALLHLGKGRGVLLGEDGHGSPGVSCLQPGSCIVFLRSTLVWKALSGMQSLELAWRTQSLLLPVLLITSQQANLVITTDCLCLGPTTWLQL